MRARNGILLAFLGAGAWGAACTQVIGAHVLPEGQGGAGTSTGTSTSTSTSTGTSTSTSTSTDTWPTTGGCSSLTDCRNCLDCMDTSVCKGIGADAGCGDGSPCNNYVECVAQCPQGTGFDTCASDCNQNPPLVAGYGVRKQCLCAQCTGACSSFCP